MTTTLFRLADRVLDRPLLIHPDKAIVILAVLEGRLPIGDVAELDEGARARIAELPTEAARVMLDDVPPFEASRFIGDHFDPVTGTWFPYARTKDGVGIITIDGSLVSRGAWIGSRSGLTSYEGLKAQLDAALGDPKVRAVLLDVHSPGGEVMGAFELADAVRAANKVKPVTAIANGMMASAAYAIGSGAGNLVAAPTSVLGSIGVLLIHADYSRAIDKAGITPTLIYAGAHKVDGNPLQPLTDQVKGDLQREVNAIYDQFIATVANGRRTMSPAAIRATEARTFLADEAVAAGLADSVGTFDDALAEITSGLGRASPSTTKGPTMRESTTGAPAAETAGNTTAAAPASAPVDAGVEREAGARAERERIAGLIALGKKMPGHDALISTLIGDGTSLDKAASRIIEAEAAIRAGKVTALADADRLAESARAAPLAPTARSERPGNVPVAQTPEGWAAEYRSSPALQGEFQVEAEYVAFKKAEASGKIKILRDRRDRGDRSASAA